MRTASLDADAGLSQRTEEQASQGIGRVGDAAAPLDQVTQQNTALVEESAAAAESPKLQAARLQELMGAFAVEWCGAGRRRLPAALTR